MQSKKEHKVKKVIYFYELGPPRIKHDRFCKPLSFKFHGDFTDKSNHYPDWISPEAAKKLSKLLKKKKGFRHFKKVCSAYYLNDQLFHTDYKGEISNVRGFSKALNPREARVLMNFTDEE